MKLLIGKTSKGVINQWYGSTNTISNKIMPYQQSFKPLGVDLFDVKELMFDPTINNAVMSTVNALFKNGWDIIDDKTNVSSKVLVNKFKKMRFDKILTSVAINAILTNRAFTELVPNKNLGVVKEFHILENAEMYVQIDPEGHGDVVGFWQYHNGIQIHFTPEEVWFFVRNKFDTNPNGFVQVKRLIELVKSKNIIQDYIKYLFDHNKFAKTWVLKNATTSQVDLLVNGLRARQKNPNKEMIVEGDVSVLGQYTIDDIPQLLGYLQYLDDQMRQLLLVPPTVGGIQASANRSTAETEFRGVFGMNINAFQRQLEDDINFELFPKMHVSHFTFKFNPIDKLDEKDAIQNAVYLKGLGFNNKTIKAYLLSKGVNNLSEGKFVKTPTTKPSGLVAHETQNIKSVSRMPTPDNVTNFGDKQKPINSQNTNVPLKTTGE